MKKQEPSKGKRKARKFSRKEQHSKERALITTSRPSVAVAQVTETKSSPLPPDEFLKVLEQIDGLGLTWTADLPVLLRPKSEKYEEVVLSEEFKRIQNTYPDFPHELTHVIYTKLTGRNYRPGIVGSKEDYEKKADAVSTIVITPEFRSAFFFKHALKVPYFSRLDWEVVLKTFEKNVKEPPGTAYAIISVLLKSSVHDSRKSNTVTFALDQQTVRNLIESLTEVQSALHAASEITKKVNPRPTNTEAGNVKRTGKSQK